MQDHHKRNRTFKDIIWGPVLTKSIATTEMVSFFARNRIVPRMLLNTESVAVVVRETDTHLLVKVILQIIAWTGVVHMSSSKGKPML